MARYRLKRHGPVMPRNTLLPDSGSSDSLQINSHSIVCTNIIAECAATTALVCSPISTYCTTVLMVIVCILAVAVRPHILILRLPFFVLPAQQGSLS